MDWSYIAGFFDGEGNLHLTFVKNKTQLQLRCRLYSSVVEVLNKIKDFIGYGYIYTNKKSNEEWSLVYELSITKKKEVFSFLNNIFPFLVIKKNHVDYILKNYHFERKSNRDFDINKFRSFITRKNTNKVIVNYNLNVQPNN